MSIYLQRKRRDEYDRKSSFITLLIVLFLLISVSVFSVILKPENPGYYEKAEKNFSAAVLKRVYRTPLPVKTEQVTQDNSKFKKVEKKSSEEKKKVLEEALTEIHEDISLTVKEEEAFKSVEGSSESELYEEISNMKSSATEKNLLIAELIELINKKKRYPPSARRRNITGTVEIIIHINSLSVISGFSIDTYDNSILKKSTERAMHKLVNTQLSSGSAGGFSVKIPVKYVLK